MITLNLFEVSMCLFIPWFKNKSPITSNVFLNIKSCYTFNRKVLVVINNIYCCFFSLKSSFPPATSKYFLKHLVHQRSKQFSTYPNYKNQMLCKY
jgi:hypothetical protein